MFAYGFGLRTISVCDLFSLVKAAHEIITDDVRNTYIEKNKETIRNQFKGYAGTPTILKNIGLGGLYTYGEGIAKQIGKEKIIKQLLRDLQPQIDAKAKAIGDTTLPLEEVIQLWESSNEVKLDNLKELIFGNTPIQEVLETLVQRFKREIQKGGSNLQPILFLVSDGNFTHADPIPLAQKLQSMGVIIISCFISNADVSNHRMLLNTPDPLWGREANLMFNLSSTMGDLPEVRRYLLQQGWKIYPQPKLFVQLNHSDILNEFIRATLSVLEDSEAARMLPKGW